MPGKANKTKRVALYYLDYYAPDVIFIRAYLVNLRKSSPRRYVINLGDGVSSLKVDRKTLRLMLGRKAEGRQFYLTKQAAEIAASKAKYRNYVATAVRNSIMTEVEAVAKLLNLPAWKEWSKK